MTVALRSLSLLGLGLGLGFAAGWWLKPVEKITHPEISAPTAVRPVNATITRIETSVAVPSAHPLHYEPLGNRARTYAWIKQHGTNLAVLPFPGDTIALQLSLTLGLTPEEMETINAALHQTRKRINELSIQAATAQRSDDGQTLIVTVPALPAESAAIYNDLLGTLTNTLGPERFQLFSELAGDSFESSFNRFGLIPARYDLTLQSTSTNGGAPTYLLKESHIDATASDTFWGSNFLTREQLEKNTPALGQFLPAELGK